MKTDNVYIGQLVRSTKVEYKGNLEDFIFGPGISRIVHHENIKLIVVKKENDWGRIIAKDLKTKKKYLCELPIQKGVLYVSPSKMYPFETLYPDAPRNLPKKKILEMGNYAIEEFNKTIKEQKNK